MGKVCLFAMIFYCTILYAIGFKYMSSIKPLKYKLNDRKFSSSLFSIIPSNNKNIISTYNPDIDRVESIELNDELKSSFMSYALSTILGRAIPDARDGLKPVHRRVLYAMHELGLFPDAGYRKSARVVGEVLGKFHPHGDQSVYDVLVRMAQDFVMLHPLVAGHGNFGSIDDDPAAAMRYTESKLSHVCYDTLLADINEDTVDFVPNFDGNEVEPRVLPARLPLLLLNGASGIAVGMATNIPPHNLNELVNAVIAIIDNPDISISELVKIVPAPDFPTGGKIMGIDGINKFYNTGSGSMIMRAKCDIDVITTNSKSGNRTRTAIIITELPYMTNKASLLERIADMVNDKKLEGISDIRDESDRDGTRVVIEIKKDAIANIVLNNLYKKTALQTSFSGNMLAVIDDGKRPQRLNLKQVLDIFIKFRFETIRRRTSFRLNKLEVREHIVLGMIKALSHIDKIIEIIRTSSDSNVVKQQLSSEEYGFSIEQIDAILSLRLGRLTSLEEEKLRQEHNQLSIDITSCKNILNDNSLVNEIIKSELKELSTKYGQPRRTEIESGSTAIINDIDLIVNNKFVVTVTESGYIKRIPYEEFESQNRGSKGKSVTKLHSDEDNISQFFVSNAHDSIMFVTNRGIAYSIKCYEIPIAARTSKGTPVPQLLAIPDDDKITSTIPIDKFTEDDSLILLTSQGYCKRTLLSAFKSIASRGLVIITLRENDSVKLARRCKNTDQVVLATRGGYATRFAVDEISCKGRSSMGVQALTLQDDDEIADMDIFEGNSTNGPKCFVAITDNGYGKRILIDDFRSKRRKTTGVIAIKLKDRTSKSKLSENQKHDALRCMRFCYPGDEITISTSKGTVSKQLVDDLTIQSRGASGYIIQRLSKDDAILTIDVVTNKDIQLINS